MSETDAIFDWADRVSAERQRLAKIRNLSTRIATFQCGDCDHWMKSRECPKERNINGYSKGPSMFAQPCSEFSEDRESKERRARLTAELTALELPDPFPAKKPRRVR